MRPGPRRIGRVLRVAVFAMVVCLVPAVAMVDANPDDDRVRVITHELMSPYCPGLLLADCRSSGAVQLREEIQQRVAAGEPTASIERVMVARFGASIRAVPPFRGTGAILWVLPGVAALLMLVVCVGLIKRSVHAPSAFHDRTPDERAAAIDGERVQDELDAIY